MFGYHIYSCYEGLLKANFSLKKRVVYYTRYVFHHVEAYRRLLNAMYNKSEYLCINVTAIKPNFHERFQADNGKNRNMPTKRMKTFLSEYAPSWCRTVVLYF